MPKSSTLQALKQELHISYSQIFTYLNCSLKYRFMYVEQQPAESISIALPFGTAVHAALEHYYRFYQEKGVVVGLEAIHRVFTDKITQDIDRTVAPILYKKTTPNKETAVEMGKALLNTFHAECDLTDFEVVAVEQPLSANLYSENKEAMDMKIIGVVDLILRDAHGNIIAVDNKTAAKPYAQETVDNDDQLTCYSYLLASNKYVLPMADVHCRYDVLRKLKTPKMEIYPTIRTRQQRRRFAKLAVAVLKGIDARVFMPNRSWLCSDCQFSTICKSW